MSAANLGILRPPKRLGVEILFQRPREPNGMIYSTTTQYAIRGLAELAARCGKGAKPPGSASMMLDQLVSGTSLPREFLAKVFQQLVKAGILTSTKGRGGGFTLARATHEISLLQVVSAIDGPAACNRCVVGLSECNDEITCPQHDLFKPIRQRLMDFLQTTTLADVVASLKSKAGWDRRETSKR